MISPAANRAILRDVESVRLHAELFTRVIDSAYRVTRVAQTGHLARRPESIYGRRLRPSVRR